LHWYAGARGGYVTQEEIAAAEFVDHVSENGLIMAGHLTLSGQSPGFETGSRNLQGTAEN